MNTTKTKRLDTITDPLDLYDPNKEIRLIYKDTPEWEEREAQRKQWLKDNPPPPESHHGYQVNANGDWEMRCATDEQLAARRKKENLSRYTFKVVVDQERRKWALRQGMMTHFFSTSDEVVIYCRRLSKGEPSVLEFYKSPREVDQWAGDDFGDFLHSESWGMS